MASHYAKGDGAAETSYAKGGGVLGRREDYSKPVDTKFKKGKGPKDCDFLETPDRFTDGKKPQGWPRANETDENWEKPDGVGQTDADDRGDTKSLKPIKPRK